MTYLQKNKQNNVTGKIYYVIGLFIFLSLLQYFGGITLKNYINIGYKPVWYLGKLVAKPLLVSKDYFFTKSALIKQNSDLNEELIKLRLKVDDYDMLQKENSDLKMQLGRGEEGKKILGNIIAKPPLSPYDKFIIDAGARNGVRVDDLVYISDKIVVGVITEVRDSSSVVGLFSDTGRNVNVSIERTGSSYSLVGQGGQNYKLEVPKDTDIIWGDLFTYPDGERSIVGTVYFIDTNSQSAFKTAYIRPPVNIFSYKTVIIQGKK